MTGLGLVRACSRLAAALIVGLLLLAATAPSRLAPSEASAPVLVWSVSVELERPPGPAPVLPRAIVSTAQPTLAPPAAATHNSTPIEITNPVWRTRPLHPERRYPADAFAAGVQGEVVLDCVVEVSGALRCVVASETPSDWGFAEAALALAAEHVMAPPTRDGAAVTGHYRMRIPFAQSPRN